MEGRGQVQEGLWLKLSKKREGLRANSPRWLQESDGQEDVEDSQRGRQAPDQGDERCLVCKGDKWTAKTQRP